MGNLIGKYIDVRISSNKKESCWGVGEMKETINCFIQDTIILNVNPNANTSY